MQTEAIREGMCMLNLKIQEKNFNNLEDVGSQPERIEGSASRSLVWV
jgi:hypothetical protein